MTVFYNIIKFEVRIASLFIFAIIASSSGCSIFGGKATQLTAEHDLIVSSASGSRTKRSAGDKISWDGKEPLLIEAAGRNPLLIVAPEVAKSVKISLPKKLQSGETEPAKVAVETSPADKENKTINGINNDLDFLTVARIVEKVQDFNVSLIEMRYDEAANRIDTLRREYPRLKIFDLMKASLLFLKGDLRQAQILIEESLKEQKDNKEAQELLKAIKKRLNT